jgi:hypothetical protein
MILVSGRLSGTLYESGPRRGPGHNASPAFSGEVQHYRKRSSKKIEQLMLLLNNRTHFGEQRVLLGVWEPRPIGGDVARIGEFRGRCEVLDRQKMSDA